MNTLSLLLLFILVLFFEVGSLLQPSLDIDCSESPRDAAAGVATDGALSCGRAAPLGTGDGTGPYTRVKECPCHPRVTLPKAVQTFTI